MLAILVPAVSRAQTTGTSTSPATCVSLNNNLRFRSRDSSTSGEVTILQNFLRSKNYLSVASTGYFGPLTLQGAKNFQRDNGITPIAGFVGPITRAKIKLLTCNSSSLTITTPATLPTAQLGVNYSTTISAAGGSGSYEWNVASGTLPDGLTLVTAQCIAAPCQTSATISGTPTQAGTYKFTMQVSSAPLTGDGPTLVATKEFTLTVGTTTGGYIGEIYINPPSGIIKLGLTGEFQAMYQPPMPPCPAGFACPAVMPAPYAVRADWTSSNTAIATVEYKDTCPAGAQCLVQQLDYKTAVVIGVKEGSTTITAKYTDASGNVLTASIPVTVQYLIR